jgi:threonine dehydrogenase-like Zn-dependent dehydrogenase
VTRVRFAGRGKVIVEEGGPPGNVPEGEVLVRVEVCGICGTDLRRFEGRWKQPEFTPGHEFAGTIETVGPSVGGLKEGQRVTAVPLIACGNCRYCRAGESNLCEAGDVMSEVRDGAMATHVAVPAGVLRCIPDAMPSEEAALLEPLSVALHGLRMFGGVDGCTLAVAGAGTLGLLFVQAGKALGAARTICAAKHPFQRDLAGSLGADTATEASGVPDELLGAADVAVDCVGGRGEGLAQAMKLVRRGGTIVAVGGYQGLTGVDMWGAVRSEISILGAFCYSMRNGVHDMDVAMRMVEEGRVRLGPLVSHRFALSEAQRAFETALDKGSSGAVKVMLLCGETA